jgi:hypothetical protein
MRIPDDSRNCVVFIRSGTHKTLVPRGTGFLVSVPWERRDPTTGVPPDRLFPYLVTARHVIASILVGSDDPIVHVRVNRLDGKWACIDTHASEWLFLDDESSATDVAVMPWNLKGLETLRMTHIPRPMFGTNEMIASGRITLGGELFVPAMFAPHTRTSSNAPVVRKGTIAALPGEPLVTKLGQMKAYIADIRSVGGMSGAPVFLGNDDGYILVGLLHGHWDDPDNTGLSIVVPAEQIWRLLDAAPLKDLREKAYEEWNPFRDPASQ